MQITRQIRARGGKARIFAHRGGAGTAAPENTRQAFDLAIRYGADGLETDTHATLDGHPVIMHDPLLDRTTDGRGPIGQYRWLDLGRVRFANGEGLMLLAEFLDRYPDQLINLDLKDERVLQPVIDLFSARPHDLQRVLFASFSIQRLKALRRAFGGRAYSSTTSLEVTRLVLADKLAARLRPAAPRADRIVAVQIPAETMKITIATPRFVALAHTQGQAVHAWTVNNITDYLRLSSWGVDGVFTDEILKLRGKSA